MGAKLGAILCGRPWTRKDGGGLGSPPFRFSWTGSNWTTSFDWVWNCHLGDGPHKLLSPATSWISYEPETDGSLRGSWHTDIASGPCRGSVIMPIAAFPR